jgi:hypothetical protein
MVLLSLAGTVRVSSIVTTIGCVYHMHPRGLRKDQFGKKVIDQKLTGEGG